MRRSNTIKWVLGIVGAIVLGALGSGFWELFLRDCFTFIGRGILTALTFGYASIRDSLYVEIAQGRTDRATLWLVSFTIFPATGVAAYTLGKRAGRRAARRNPNRTIEVVEREEDTFERILILFCIFFASILVFRYATLSYVSSAITHYEQAYEICLPYLSESDLAASRSAFARIKSREDYVRVIDKLAEAASAHHVTLPKFTPW